MITAAIAFIVGAIVIGDATAAATVSAIVSVLNIIHNDRQHRRLRNVIVAPRRIVFDNAGNPVGTVLDLDNNMAQNLPHIQVNRRQDDPDPPAGV